jgi:hypothetical protein
MIEPSYRDLVELSGRVGNPPHKPPDAEGGIRRRMEHCAETMAIHRRLLGYDRLLERHYLEGCRHPDDINEPLNKWEET